LTDIGRAVETHVAIERHDAAAILSLARPDALNAISADMRRSLTRALTGYGRDPGLYAVVLKSAVAGVFSVGGDVREILAAATEDAASGRQALAEEYMLCWIAECLSKPTVSLINGQVMGTGAGISLYNTHRVAGEGYRFSMPETRLGYFPDCGLCRTFARLPDCIGLYLGLTGQVLRRADALALGLVTHCIPSAQFAEIELRLADADPIDPLLDERHVDPGPAPLIEGSGRIARYFAAPSLAECLARLRKPEAADREFASATLDILARRSPTALAVTDRMIRLAGGLDLAQALSLDHCVGSRMLFRSDFREGVRAHLADKDDAPRWSPDRIEDVGEGLLDELFTPMTEGGLELPPREAMQAARV
jgi:enoyl-CoA hydratase